jgi:ketosteroid isomerase-like protein
VLDPAGRRIGTFTSIWRREPSGEWKIIFDRGCPHCAQCAPAAKKE